MKKSLVGLLVLGIAQISFGMQPTAAKAAGQLLKHYGKKAFSGTMTGLHWTIAAGLPMAFGANQARCIIYEEKVCAQLPNASEQTTSFITSEMQKNGISIDAVKKNPLYDILLAPMGTLKRHILISTSTDKEIDTAVKNNDSATQQKWKSTLGHEARHIHHNDAAWQAAIGLTIPFITHKTTQTLRNLLPHAKKVKPFLVEQCIKVPTGLGKLTLSMGVFTGFMRYQEQRADNEIANDIDTLSGLKNVLTELNLEQKKQLRGLSPSQIKLVQKTDLLFGTHPSTEARIEKLDQRIALLEKDQKDESCNS